MDCHAEMRSNKDEPVYSKKGAVEYLRDRSTLERPEERQRLNAVGSMADPKLTINGQQVFPQTILDLYVEGRIEECSRGKRKYTRERDRFFDGGHHVNVAKVARLWGVSAPYARKLVAQHARKAGREWYIRLDVAAQIRPFIPKVGENLAVQIAESHWKLSDVVERQVFETQP